MMSSMVTRCRSGALFALRCSNSLKRSMSAATRVATGPGDSALMPAQIAPLMSALIFLNLPSA